MELSEAVAEAVTGVNIPIWIGVSASRREDDSTLSVFSYSDRDFETLVQVLSKFPALLMNVSHTAVPDVDQAMPVVRKHWEGPIGIYPESGYFSMPNWNFFEIVNPIDLAIKAEEWVNNGARLIGGFLTPLSNPPSGTRCARLELLCGAQESAPRCSVPGGNRFGGGATRTLPSRSETTWVE